MTKNWEKNLQLEKNFFFNKKMQFNYPLAFIKDAQATREAFSLKKRTSSTSKHKISLLFSIFVVFFFPHGS
jgi:hypothetical protein